ncbi:MAG: type IV pilus modification PilV family protein [Limisphaerales bacterium]
MKKVLKQTIRAFTLAEVLIAVGIFVVAIFAILQLVGQGLELVRVMQQQRPDMGALAAKTLVELPEPDGTLATGLTEPLDEDFGGNGGGEFTLYPDARWQRDIMSLDATNGLYQATITIEEQVGGGENTEYQLRFLMFRPDLAELEMGGAQGAGLGGR